MDSTETMNSTETLIRDLADRAELTELVARHSVWVDERRFDETEQLFTADVVVESMRGRAVGIDELHRVVGHGHDRYLRTLHSKSNIVVELDGDTADVRAHDIGVYVLDDDTEAIAAAQHHYGARRTEKGWRFDRLKVVPFALTEAIGRNL
ncbi:nuclear transport factor 2 family protein [Nocardia vermiculata]|nr:nuclear transport factor 2 family protein [Nocardia vermiculata]